MKISGFTFIRNGVQFDYPFEESIRSVLPLVNEMIVNVGRGEDETLARVQALAQENSKIRIIENTWDEKVRKEGRILAEQTNLAMRECTGDWGIYIQADEVLHEDDLPRIRYSLEEADARPEVQGLLFDYVHFYGDYSIINRNTTAYRHEVRAIRLNQNIESYRDAQGFRRRTEAGELVKLKVVPSRGRIFHYGWVKPPQTMEAKTRVMDRLYHEGENATGDNHSYKHILGLARFTRTHPKLMQKRIAEKKWPDLDLLAQPLVFKFGDIRKLLALLFERITGRLPFSYKNFTRVD